MQLAKQSGLPKEIIEIIRDHHGTQAIRYFLKKAQESNQETPQNIFYYNGPKPVSKISVIIMIADIVESKTKVFNEFNPEIVEKTIDELIANKQFAETQLSFRELKQIKEVMNVVLGSIYRKRKDYKLED
jgi:membrane-associated HD superfamily phosphohydrolase